MTDSDASSLRRTVLHPVHQEAGATLCDFHGWSMPIRYGSIPDEHRHVRESAGLFDLGHMGRLELTGPGAEAWLQHVLTADVSSMRAGRARYALLTTDEGTPIDDAIVYRLDGSWFLVVNAGGRQRDIEWILAHRPAGAGDASLTDRSEELAMIALQGPRAATILPELVQDPDRPWDTLSYYAIQNARFEGQEVRVARTGYTGEDGFEVYLPSDLGLTFWRRALEAGEGAVRPIGLGARDTLRLEAGMPLYGNEIDETTDPFEAGLGFAVKLDKPEPFVGKERLLERRGQPPRRRLCGLRVDGKRSARAGMDVLLGESRVGRVTSGAPSPTLGHPIAMAWIDAEALEAADAGGLTVDVRGRKEPVTVVAMPFFSRTRKKSG